MGLPDPPGCHATPAIPRPRRVQRVVDRRPILELALVDPQPITGHDVQYPPGMHLARVEDAHGVRPRLVQVDTEYEFRRADRGRPELRTFDPAAWGNERLVPTEPISASFAACTSTSRPCAMCAIPTSRPRKGRRRSAPRRRTGRESPRSDVPARLDPVFVAQRTFGELPPVGPWELLPEVNRPRALVQARRAAHQANNSSARSGVGRTPPLSSTTALTCSPHSGSGTPMTATSATSGCGRQHAFDLGRIDIDASTDDEVLGAVTDEREVPVRRRDSPCRRW